jgi:uncharacterized protein (TIGR02646 family)
MIHRIPFVLKLTVAEHRRLVVKKPWVGKWNDNDITDIKSKIKAQLSTVQTCCAYCGLPFKGEKDKQIEHIAPKASYRQPEFTFTLQNLVLSCGYCNNLIVKGTKPTVMVPVNRCYSKCNFFIVHPYFDDPSHHYGWADWGSSILIQVANDSGKARNSIRMFSLDSLEMSELRAAVKLLADRKTQKPLSNNDEKLVQETLDYKQE